MLEFKWLILFFIKSVALLMLISIGAGCNNQENKNLVLPVDSKKLAQLVSYYENIKNGITEIKPSVNYKEQIQLFNEQEMKIPVKGYHFGSEYIGSNIYYYEVGRFEYDGNIYKLIFYNKLGEADTPLFNVQLNSYNVSGNLVDALLLSSFFGYEGMDCFSEFVINSNHKITIHHYVVYRYKEAKDERSTELIEMPSPEVYLKEEYEIIKGQFKTISRNKVENHETEN